MTCNCGKLVKTCMVIRICQTIRCMLSKLSCCYNRNFLSLTYFRMTDFSHLLERLHKRLYRKHFKKKQTIIISATTVDNKII